LRCLLFRPSSGRTCRLICRADRALPDDGNRCSKSAVRPCRVPRAAPRSLIDGRCRTRADRASRVRRWRHAAQAAAQRRNGTQPPGRQADVQGKELGPGRPHQSHRNARAWRRQAAGFRHVLGRLDRCLHGRASHMHTDNMDVGSAG
jgi:hypothetical protein